MAYQITIKNSVHDKLKELKGEGSFSNVIESLIEKSTPVTAFKQETGASQHTG